MKKRIFIKSSIFLVVSTFILSLLFCSKHDNESSSTQQNQLTVKLEKSYYTSLCWYGLQQLGFAGDPVNPEYEQWSDRLSDLVGDFRFRAPVAEVPLFQFVYQIPGYINPKDTGCITMVSRWLSDPVLVVKIQCVLTSNALIHVLYPRITKYVVYYTQSLWWWSDSKI